MLFPDSRKRTNIEKYPWVKNSNFILFPSKGATEIGGDDTELGSIFISIVAFANSLSLINVVCHSS